MKNIQKWEYLVVRTTAGKVTSVDGQKVKPEHGWLAFLGQKGLEGWELVSRNHLGGQFFEASFKRPLTTDTDQ